MSSSLCLTCLCDPVSIYDVFCDNKVVAFVTKHKFVNAAFMIVGLNIKIYLNSYNSKPKYPMNVSWNNIQCTKLRNCDFIKKSPCKIGNPNKVFFKNADNLKDYIEKLNSKKISQKDHIKLFVTTLKAFKNQKMFVNHNLDIKYLHFKES